MRTNLIKPKEDDISVEKVSTESGKLDMVIAFDTTGSMNRYIDAVRWHIKSLIPQLFADNPNIRISIVAFGDYCDMKDKDNFGNAYKEALEMVQKNPIKNYIEGEDRVLRGYKIQFVSRDGKYKCIDMDIKKTDKETGERLVNINTISALVVNGTKYVVK